MNRFIILFLFSLGILSTCVFAVEVIPLNEGWNFHRGFQAPASEIVKVTLPHTWNAGDGMFGNADYYRGLCNYSRKLSVPAHYRGKRFFLKVMAAQTVADIFIDHHFVMQHKGGYTAFVAELGLSRSHLYKKLMCITGKGPAEFIRIIRLKRSKQLLKESQKQIAEIAYEVGFSSPKRFTVNFKNEFGISPSDYIRSLK